MLGSAVAEVWASLYTPARWLRARPREWASGGAHMAVLVQQMLIPDVSFILMTRHPMTNDPNTATPSSRWVTAKLWRRGRCEARRGACP